MSTPKPGAKKVKAPKEVFTVIYPDWHGDFCANCYLTKKDADEEIAIAKVPPNVVKYLRADIAPPSTSEEGRLKEAVVKAAMAYKRSIHSLSTLKERASDALLDACDALTLELARPIHLRSTRAKAGGKGERT